MNLTREVLLQHHQFLLELRRARTVIQVKNLLHVASASSLKVLVLLAKAVLHGRIHFIYAPGVSKRAFTQLRRHKEPLRKLVASCTSLLRKGRAVILEELLNVVSVIKLLTIPLFPDLAPANKETAPPPDLLKQSTMPPSSPKDNGNPDPTEGAVPKVTQPERPQTLEVPTASLSTCASGPPGSRSPPPSPPASQRTEARASPDLIPSSQGTRGGSNASEEESADKNEDKHKPKEVRDPQVTGTRGGKAEETKDKEEKEEEEELQASQAERPGAETRPPVRRGQVSSTSDPSSQ